MVHSGVNPSPLVLALEPVDRTPLRVYVVLDDDTRVETTLDFALDEGVREGTPIDEQLRARLIHAGLEAKARDQALRLLAYRPRSRSELGQRLRAKEIPHRIVDPCLDRLEEDRLLDDHAFARAYARDRLRLKPRARKALLVELRRKGVAESVASAAVEDVLSEDGINESELAKDVALGWLERQSRDVAAGFLAERYTEEYRRVDRRLRGYMTRRGFGGQSLAGALEAVRHEVKEGDPA